MQDAREKVCDDLLKARNLMMMVWDAVKVILSFSHTAFVCCLALFFSLHNVLRYGSLHNEERDGLALFFSLHNVLRYSSAYTMKRGLALWELTQ